MIIGGIQFNSDLIDILIELKHQLSLNNIMLLDKIKESGDDIMVQCPYHGGGQERRPSAGIRKLDGQFHCFACNESHSLAEVITHCFGHTDDILGKFGWNWLLKNFATVAVEERKPIELNFSRIHEKDKVEYVSEEELDKYRYYHSYWKKRKITDERIIELFDLGYDKGTDCITMPVRDIDGNCLFVARRSVKTKWFNYPRSVTKPLYGIYELHQSMNHAVKILLSQGRCNGKTGQLRAFVEIIVCESMIDALTAWQYGKFAVALNGLGTEYQFQQLRNLPCRKLILATDNDKAGMEARKRIRANVKNKIITEYLLPEGKKDLNDLTKEEFNNLQEIF